MDRGLGLKTWVYHAHDEIAAADARVAPCRRGDLDSLVTGAAEPWFTACAVSRRGVPFGTGQVERCRLGTVSGHGAPSPRRPLPWIGGAHGANAECRASQRTLEGTLGSIPEELGEVAGLLVRGLLRPRLAFVGAGSCGKAGAGVPTYAVSGPRPASRASPSTDTARRLRPRSG